MITPHGSPSHSDHRIRSAYQPVQLRIIEHCGTAISRCPRTHPNAMVPPHIEGGVDE